MSRKHSTFIDFLAIPLPIGPQASFGLLAHFGKAFARFSGPFLEVDETGEIVADERVYGRAMLSGIDAGLPQASFIDGEGDVLHLHRICVTVFLVKLRPL